MFPGLSELDQIEKILRILGTPSREQWRDGYQLADKRSYVMTIYNGKNLGKILPGIGDEALEALKQMLKVSAQDRATAAQLLKMPFFAGPDASPKEAASPK